MSFVSDVNSGVHPGGSMTTKKVTTEARKISNIA
jgi:hypothetical protein